MYGWQKRTALPLMPASIPFHKEVRYDRSVGGGSHFVVGSTSPNLPLESTTCVVPSATSAMKKNSAAVLPVWVR